MDGAEPGHVYALYRTYDQDGVLYKSENWGESWRVLHRNEYCEAT